MKFHKTIISAIIISMAFSTILIAQMIKPSRDKAEYIDYYNSIRKAVLSKNYPDCNKIEIRQLRFGATLYCIGKELNALSNKNTGFLKKEKSELKSNIANGNTREAVHISKEILREDLTYLPALKYYSESNMKDINEAKFFRDLFELIKSSLIKSGDGKSVQTAYEIFNNIEKDFLLAGHCESFMMEHIEKNGRVYESVNCGNTSADTQKIYFDVTAISTMKLTSREKSLSNELKMQKQQIKEIVKASSIRTQVFSKSFIPDTTRLKADAMASKFIRLYRECKWDSLWEHYKEKSPYYNPQENFEKNNFFGYIRKIYDTCGTFESAELANFNMFKFGSSLSKALEYQYKAKYSKSERILFLEIWTCRDSVENIMHFGFSRRNDDD
jgi:hypothetical protein